MHIEGVLVGLKLRLANSVCLSLSLSLFVSLFLSLSVSDSVCLSVCLSHLPQFVCVYREKYQFPAQGKVIP